MHGSSDPSNAPLDLLCLTLPWDEVLLRRDRVHLPAFRRWLVHDATPKQAERFAVAFGLPDSTDFWRRSESERAAAVENHLVTRGLDAIPDALWAGFATRNRDNGRCDLRRLDPHPLPPATWLVHFSHDAQTLFDGAELRGTACPEPVALRATFDADKPGPGYNFAFLAGSFESNIHGRDDFYGDGALLFRAPGVRIFHVSDEDEEIIFWGPDMGDAFLLHRGDIDTPWRGGAGDGTLAEHADLNTVIRQLLACAAQRGW